jgi:hypothetical protein
MMERKFSIGQMLAAVAIVALGFARAQAGQSEWDSRRDEQRKSYEALMDNVPLLPQTHPHEIMRLRVEDKVLMLRTPLFSTSGDGYARVKFNGMNGCALVRVQGGADTTDGDLVAPFNFQFTLNDYTQPQRITTYSVTSEQTYLTISKSVQLPDGYSNVQLIERVGSPGYGHSGAVQLVVSESAASKRSMTNVNLEAADFFELVCANPREAEQYLRPLLRELGQEEALAPDPLVAWQVFADRWHADPSTTAQVQQLLPKLDSDDFRIREKASRDLQDLGREGAAVMVHLDRSALTAEQCDRIDRALSAYAQLPPKEAQRLRTDRSFLLDCLNCDELPLRQAAYDQLAKLHIPLRLDVSSDPETRAAAIAALRPVVASNDMGR